PKTRVYLSPSFKAMFGYDEHELPDTEEVFTRLLHPEDFKIAQANLERHIATRGTYPYYQEVRYMHKDGSTRWVVCRGKVTSWGEDDKPLRMVGTHTDVTAFKTLPALEKLITHEIAESEGFKRENSFLSA